MCGGGPTGVETAAVRYAWTISYIRWLNQLQEIYDLCQEDILQYVTILFFAPKKSNFLAQAGLL